MSDGTPGPVGFDDPKPDEPTILPPSIGTDLPPSPYALPVPPPDPSSVRGESGAAAAPLAAAPAPETSSTPPPLFPRAAAPQQPSQQQPLLPQQPYIPAGFEMPPSKPILPSTTVPSMKAPATPVPGDLIEIDASALGKSEFLKDSGARVREAKPTEKQLKQEETAEQAWRRILSGLETTDFVHVKLYRRRFDGSYIPLGARYHMSADEVRAIEKILPYAGRYIIAIAHASNRADNEQAYRKFLYEREGPEMPEGWSFDGAFDWDQEIDMPTAREMFEEFTRRQQAAQPQQTVTPFPGPGGAPWGMPGYPSYPPYYPMPGMGGMPFGMGAGDDERRRREDDERRRADEERRRREEEERRRREEEEKRRADDERRRREEEAKERRDYEEKRDRERREEREKLEGERKVSEERHAREMEALRKIAEDARASTEKTAKDWQDRFAQEQQRWRDDRDRLEREAASAAHRSELIGVTGVVDSLRKEIADLKNGGMLSAKSGTDWSALANSVVPLITGYLSSERESRSDERRARLEDVSRERDRASRDAEQMTKLVSMLGESQINSAKVAGDLIQRMQDPSALMNLTRLVSETLGGNVQLVAQLVKSGLTGGGQSSGIDWGGLIGQGLETLGGIATSFTELKQEQLRVSGTQPLMPPPVGFTGQPQMQPQPRPQPMPQPRQPQQPQQPQPAGQPKVGAALLRGMVDTIKEAIAREHDPKEVAGMIDAMVYSAQKYKIDKADPKSAAFVKAIQTDPEKTLRAAFPQSRPEYIHLIAEALTADDEDEEASEDEGDNGSAKPQPVAARPRPAPRAATEMPASQPAAAPPPAAPAGDVVAMPSRRGRGRPRKTDTPPPASPPPAQPPPEPSAG